MSEDKIVVYEEMKKFENSNDVLIIDVRGVDEVINTGKIGGSINIPVDTLENVLNTLDDKAFKEKYGKSKPSKDFPLVFTCLKGGRAARGAEVADKLGYKNAKYYKGSWSEWEAKMV